MLLLNKFSTWEKGFILEQHPSLEKNNDASIPLPTSLQPEAWSTQREKENNGKHKPQA
jgi:hypothetical protein